MLVEIQDEPFVVLEGFVVVHQLVRKLFILLQLIDVVVEFLLVYFGTHLLQFQVSYVRCLLVKVQDREHLVESLLPL